ncbi:MAG TPA: thioredoxin [Xylella sp.]
MSDKPHVFDVTDATFETGVLKKSLQTPVLVDFWAPWCGPCRALSPVLEKLAAEYHGAFELAKIDVDQEQQVAAAFQIRSVPTVYLIKGGQLVDGFPGAKPEGQIREFLTKHGILPAQSDVSKEVSPAVPLDLPAEIARLRQALEATPENNDLKIDLALALLKTGEIKEASVLIDALPVKMATDDRVLHAKARLRLTLLLNDAPSVDVLQAAFVKDPSDLHTRHLLGMRLLFDGQNEMALEHFFEMLRQDRDFDDGVPRKALIDAFHLIEDKDMVSLYRRKMSALLF